MCCSCAGLQCRSGICPQCLQAHQEPDVVGVDDLLPVTLLHGLRCIMLREEPLELGSHVVSVAFLPASVRIQLSKLCPHEGTQQPQPSKAPSAASGMQGVAAKRNLGEGSIVCVSSAAPSASHLPSYECSTLQASTLRSSTHVLPFAGSRWYRTVKRLLSTELPSSCTQIDKGHARQGYQCTTLRSLPKPVRCHICVQPCMAALGDNG